MNERIVSTGLGLAVVLVSPCCKSEMDLYPGKLRVYQTEARMETPLYFRCKKCKADYIPTLNYDRVIDNVEVTITVRKEP
jgi:hypothetical protein